RQQQEFAFEQDRQRQERRRAEHLANLRSATEKAMAFALEEVRASRFDEAEAILDRAAEHLDGEPQLTGQLTALRARLESRRDQVHRLAAFYRLADRAER